MHDEPVLWSEERGPAKQTVVGHLSGPTIGTRG